MNDCSELLYSVEERARQQGMRVSRNVELPGGPVAELTASRTRFSWKGLVVLSQHIIVRCTESASPADAEALFEKGFQYAKRVNRVPLPRGLQFAYVVIPCLVVNEAEDDLVHYVESLPPKHWSLFQFPVAVDLGRRTTHYCRKTAFWGGFYFADMRGLVELHCGSLDRITSLRDDRGRRCA